MYNECSIMPAVPLFVSYSHKDQLLLDKLVTHLESLETDGLVQLWDDRDLRAGSSKGWEEELLRKLNTARVIVLLLSPAFAASPYCQQKEVPRALERKLAGEALVYLVHLRTHRIQANLREFQIRPSVSISIADSPKPNVQFTRIAEEIGNDLATFKPAQTTTVLRRSTKSLPPYLPYLCNRTDQEEPLLSLREQTDAISLRPIVYAVAGPDIECHEAFHERIAKDFLPRLVGVPGPAAVDPIPIDWPSRANPGPEADATFARRIALKLDSFSSKPADILSTLPDGLTYLVTTISGDDWDARQQELLKSFLNFWNGWPDLPGNRAICVGISIIRKNSGPSGDTLRTLFPAADFPKIRFCVLPDLQSPTERDAINWLSHRKVKTWYDWEMHRNDLSTSVRKTFSTRPAIPMGELASPLIQLLESVI